MSAELYVIEHVDPPPSEGVVAMFETLLADAKSGEIISAACALVYRDGTTSSSFYKPGAVEEAQLVGVLAVLQKEILDAS